MRGFEVLRSCSAMPRTCSRPRRKEHPTRAPSDSFCIRCSTTSGKNLESIESIEFSLPNRRESFRPAFRPAGARVSRSGCPRSYRLPG